MTEIINLIIANGLHGLKIHLKGELTTKKPHRLKGGAIWVFTKHGFFSVVQDKYCDDEQVMVRARCKGDLKRLTKCLEANGLLLTRDKRILRFDFADYLFRLKLPRETWAEYLYGMASTIDYPTVKDTIQPTKDKRRHDTYYRIWGALVNWQDVAYGLKNRWERRVLHGFRQ